MSIHEIVANHDEGMFASGPSFLLKFSEFLFVLSNFLIFFFFFYPYLSHPASKTKKQPQTTSASVFQDLTYFVRPLFDQWLLLVERLPLVK